MKSTFKKLTLTAVLMIGLIGAAHANDGKIPADNSSPELQKIKSLEGKWVSTTSMFGKKNQKVYTEYKVTAGGSAVLEKAFPGTPQEMVSVYYDNNGKLTMTHYCLMRNRPTLELAKSTNDTFVMKVKKVEDAKKGDHSMGDITLNFKDKNHFTSTCSANKKKNEPAMSMEFTRVK